MPQHRSTRST